MMNGIEKGIFSPEDLREHFHSFTRIQISLSQLGADDQALFRETLREIIKQPETNFDNTLVEIRALPVVGEDHPAYAL